MSKIRYETINGTLCRVEEHPVPVVEGSAEWALWSAEHGMSFVHKDAKQFRLFSMFSETELRVTDAEGECVEIITLDDFLAYAAKDGWCIYEEPEPETPIAPIEIPLRSLILKAKEEGKNIRTFYQDMIFTPDALTGLLEQGKFRWWNLSNWELTDRKQNYYAPITLDKPAFKIGDWVTDGIVTGYISSIPIEIPDVTTQNGSVHSIYAEHLRKVDPSEVTVKIGCLEGTVRLCDNKNICPESTMENPCHIILQNQVTGYWSAICFKELDPSLRAFVERLLTEQEAEK